MADQPIVVHCRCYGGLGMGPDHKSAWEDVWLRWETAETEICATLKCRAELLRDLKDAQALYAADTSDADWRQEVARCERLLHILSDKAYAIDKPADPTYVYTTANGLNRAEAEFMLTAFLRERHGLVNPSFQWMELGSGGGVTSMGFGDYDTEDDSPSGGMKIN